jgi:uncharacterized protein
MTEYQNRGISPSAAFFILIAFVGAGMILSVFVGALIWVAMTGRDMLSIATDILKPEYANAAKTFQLVVTFIMFFVPAVVTVRLMTSRPFQFLGFREGFNVQQLLVVLGLVFVCLPLSGALGDLTTRIPLSKSLDTYFKQLEDQYNSQAMALARMRSPGEYLFSLVVMALLPAVFEETLFRGGLQQILIAWFRKPLPAIIVTSIIFSLVHISYFGFLSRFALGMVLGLIFYYSRSIYLNMTAHFINNAVAVSFLYYFTVQKKPLKDITDDNIAYWWGIPALVAVCLMLWYFRKESRRRLVNRLPNMDGPMPESDLA